MTPIQIDRTRSRQPIRYPGLLRLALSLVVACGVAIPFALADSPTPNVDQLIANSANGVVVAGNPLPANLDLTARKATAWKDGDATRVLLEQDATVAIGKYGFRADRVVVFINPVKTAGVRVYRLELYLDKVSELGGYGPITNHARRLLVTATIRGRVNLKADALNKTPAADHPLVADATARVERYYRSLQQQVVSLTDGTPLHDQALLDKRAEWQGRVRGGKVAAIEAPTVVIKPPTTTTKPDEPTKPVTPPVTDATPPVTPPKTDDKQPELPVSPGLVQFQAGSLVYQLGEDESYALLVGGVKVLYHDPQKDLSVTLSADRAVIFTEPDLEQGQTELDASAVRAVYLEDNVIATNGQYTMRGPRVMYDLQNDRAIVLEAVFYTYDIKYQVPLYMRARKIMQVSNEQWRAEGAKLSTSEFHEPHFAIGSDRLTITQSERPDGTKAYAYRSEDTSLQVGGTPLFYWPSMSGNVNDSPLRDVRVDANDDDGVSVKTEWDLFSLIDVEAPKGVDARLLFDVYTERGAGGGLDVDYDAPKAFGQLEAYLLYDEGEDEPGGRGEIEPDDELRGKFFWQHRHYLPDGWEVSAEVGYASDETFLEEFFPDEAYTDKPWETSFYAKKQEADEAFTFLFKYELNDFFPQTERWQTGSFATEKLPEIAYRRIGTPLFDNKVTWYSETRGGALRAQFPDVRPDELGFNAAESMRLFGIAPTTSFDAPGLTLGLDDETVYRFDTRQELQLPMRVSMIDVVPYLVGRITAFDDDFSGISGEDDNTRLWGSAGIKLHTTLSRTYNDVDNRLLDIHRLRHIIEPSVHAFYSATNIDGRGWPFFYDYDVENITEGGSVRLGLRNVLETQRGGPGRWQSVEMFRLDTDFVLQDSDNAQLSPVARFIGYRPEYSTAGDHFWTEMAWQVTDSLQTLGNLNYSFESDTVERWNYGIKLAHHPRLTSFGQVRRIDELDSTVFQYGFDYLVSPKYHLAFAQSFDLDRGRNRDLEVLVTRRLPRMLLMLAFSYDSVDDTTSVGIALTPEGLGGSGAPEDNPFLYGN